MRGINMLGMLDIKGNETIRRVYGIDGIAPTLTTCGGGNTQAKILVGGDEMKVFAERGRPTADGGYKVKAEFQTEDYANTISGNPGLNMLLEYGGQYMKKLKVNDLFCGAGGMGIGFKQAGFETAGAWDFDKYAVQAYFHNVDSIVKQADITQMNWDDMLQADVWTFGFPCQDLSIAGKQAGLFEGKRSGLFFEVMRLLDEGIESDINSLPSIIMAENVKGLKPYLNVLEDEYKKRGYKMYYTLYNSKFWGLAQNRERYFVVGVHESIDKEFKFPVQQEDYIPRLSAFLDPVVDEKYYIDYLKAAKIIEQAKMKIELKETHSCITPERVEKKQNGRRAKENEEEMFTITAQDKHGVIEKEQPKIINLGNTNPSGRGMNGNVIHQDGITGALTTNKGEGIKVAVRSEMNGNAEEGNTNKTLQSLWENDGTEEIEKRGINEPSTLQQTSLLQQGVYEEGVFSSEGGKSELGNISQESETTKECEQMRDMWQHEEYRHTPQGRGLAEQRTNEPIGSLQELPYENTQESEFQYRVRKLTEREYMRLQGFPEDFEIVCSASQTYKQAGNAVSVPVARAIAERIKMFLFSL